MINIDCRKTKGRWPYILNSDHFYILTRAWPEDLTHKFFFIEDGVLHIHQDYAWDGVSCFPDRDEWLFASLVHDCLIQACDEKLCDDMYRDMAHKEMKAILKLTSNSFWASVMYVGLRFGHRGYVWIRNKFLRR